MKKGSRHFYRRLLLVYTAILVGEVVLLVLYFISELRQQARETNLEYMEMEGTEGREYILDSMEDAEHIHSSLYNSYDEFNDLYHYLSDEIDVYMEYRLDNYGGNTAVFHQSPFPFGNNGHHFLAEYGKYPVYAGGAPDYGRGPQKLPKRYEPKDAGLQIPYEYFLSGPDFPEGSGLPLFPVSEQCQKRRG